MGLIGNNFRLNTGVHRCLGDVMARTPGNAKRYSSFCNTNSQELATEVLSGNAIPSGGYPSATFYPPQESGQMSMRSFSEGDLNAYLYPSKNMSIDLTGAGDLDADAALVIAMFLDMIGSGDLTATITGNLNMSIDMEGSGNLTASMSGIANMLIAMIGEGTFEAAIAAYGNMSIDMVVTGTGLSTANVGKYVWEALVAQFASDPNSAAAKLLASASAGDPWSTNLPAAYTGTQAGNILSQIQALVDELHQLEGLKSGSPMVVTPTSRTVGSINLEITGDGENLTQVERL